MCSKSRIPSSTRIATKKAKKDVNIVWDLCLCVRRVWGGELLALRDPNCMAKYSYQYYTHLTASFPGKPG